MSGKRVGSVLDIGNRPPTFVPQISVCQFMRDHPKGEGFSTLSQIGPQHNTSSHIIPGTWRWDDQLPPDSGDVVVDGEAETWIAEKILLNLFGQGLQDIPHPLL